MFGRITKRSSRYRRRAREPKGTEMVRTSWSDMQNAYDPSMQCTIVKVTKDDDFNEKFNEMTNS